jgi:steroid 5-alpha reductase family enzyme
MSILMLFAVNAAVCVALFLAMWGVGLVLRDVTFVDSVWALGMVVLAVSSFIATGPSTPHKVALTAVCALWGLRLGGYLLWRWRSHGPDRRYIRMMEKAKDGKGWGFAEATLRLVFATQAPLLFIVCLPVQLGQLDTAPGPLGPIALAGVALSLFGISFETLADWQLTRFRTDPQNRGQVLSTGLWRYTRHPNYFGDACTWWGLLLIAAEAPHGLFALPGPMLLTWTLMKWSGAPTLEYRLRKTRPDYVRYMETTSGFVPWPPKR